MFEQKRFHELQEGDWVEPDQLLALVNPTVQVNDVASKVAKMVTAEADYQAAIKTKEEAIRRAESRSLFRRARATSRKTTTTPTYSTATATSRKKAKDAARRWRARR